MKRFGFQHITVALIVATMVHKSGGQTASPLEVQPAPFGQFQHGGIDDSITINSAFAPDDHTVYFSKSHAGFAGLTIFESHLRGNKWSEPEVAPFSGIYRDVDPAVSPDGKRLVFASMRDSKGNPAMKYSLFEVALPFSEGMPIEPLSPGINNGDSILYPSFSKDGSLYFIRSMGKITRIFRSAYREGKFATPELVSLAEDSDSIFDSDPTIAPDQSFIVFASNRPDSLGSNDLYISFRQGEKWCSPIHFEAPINSAQAEVATGLSPDAKTLYFASSRSSLKQPRAARVTADTFRAEAARYDNGVSHLYQTDLNAWIIGHQHDMATCGTNGQSE
jgi:Tol biopolymer transport system component